MIRGQSGNYPFAFVIISEISSDFIPCILTNRRVRNFLIVPTTSSVATPLRPSNAKRSRDLNFRPLPLPFFGFRLVSSL